MITEKALVGSLIVVCLFFMSFGLTQVRADSAPTSMVLVATPSVVSVDNNIPINVACSLTSNGVGLINAPVNCYYKIGTTGTWTIWNGWYTDTSGNVAWLFYPQAYNIPAGSNLYFKAVYNGEETYTACNAETTNPVTTVHSTATSMILVATPSIVSVDNNIPINVACQLTSNGVGLTNAPVNCYYKIGTSGTWTIWNGWYTDTSGNVAWLFYPQAYNIPAGSNLYFKAIYNGDNQYTASNAETTNPVTTVHSTATSMILDATPSIVSLADNIPFNVACSLTSNGIGLTNAPVNCYYKIGTSGTWTIWNGWYTDTSGNVAWLFYPETYNIPSGSNLYFKAVYNGDETYTACNAETTNPVTYMSTLFVVPEYPLGVAAVLAACFGAFLVYKKSRDSNPLR